jgi:hypothetical protein
MHDTPRPAGVVATSGKPWMSARPVADRLLVASYYPVTRGSRRPRTVREGHATATRTARTSCMGPIPAGGLQGLGLDE